jgi:hypothetical protein
LLQLSRKLTKQASLLNFATNCTPMVSPASFQCGGTDIAGCPVTLNRGVSMVTENFHLIFRCHFVEKHRAR